MYNEVIMMTFRCDKWIFEDIYLYVRGSLLKHVLLVTIYLHEVPNLVCTVFVVQVTSEALK